MNVIHCNIARPRRGSMIRIAAVIASVFACMAGGGASALLAQSPSPQLAAIDSLIAASRFRDARAALERWESANSSTVAPAERATALLLRARMIQDGDSARDAYLSLSLGYPSSPEAAVALLRLGQLALAAGDDARAASYFQRIVSDHPKAAVRGEAQSWLARTKSTAKPSPAAPGNAGGTGAGTPKAPESSAAFALQVGAFRDLDAANGVVKRLEKAGFISRAVRVPVNQLVRVRVGRFATSRDADDIMKKLRAAGFEAIVVNDARTETAATK